MLTKRKLGKAAVAATALTVLVAATLTAGPVPRASAGQLGGSCAWGIEAVGSRLDLNTPTNVVFPDTAANYWITTIPMGPKTKIRLTGEWPRARYFSVQTYNASNVFARAAGSLRDDQIVPNPDGSYEVVVKAHAADDEPNTISGLLGGRRIGLTWIMFRTYLSEDQAQPAGGVALPTLEVTDRRGTRTLPFCATDTPEGGSGEFPPDHTQGSLGGFGLVKPTKPRWSRPGGQLTPFTNADSAYLAALVGRFKDHVLVVRGLAPTFPDGDTRTDDAQVRFWSLCKFSLPSTSTVACTSDADTPLDARGRYTYVVSDYPDRPANATIENGVAWMPWGREIFGAVGLRNMVPADDFEYAIQNIGPGNPPAQAMGPYYPEIGYCPTSTFESAGADACLAPT